MDMLCKEVSDLLEQKADRLFASIRAKDPREAAKRRRVEAFRKIAQWSLHGIDAVRQGLAADHALSADEVSRKAVGDEVSALAGRRHAGTLEGVHLYELSTTIYYNEYFAFLSGVMWEELGEFEKAISVFESLHGGYARHAPEFIERCRGKMAGTYDVFAQLSAQMEKLMPALGGEGGVMARIEAAAVGLAAGESIPREVSQDHFASDPETRRIFNMLAQLGMFTEGPAAGEPVPHEVSEDHKVPDSDQETLDHATLVAQTFVENVVDGDYAAAYALLAPEAGMSVEKIQKAYKKLIEGNDVIGAGLIDVAVLACDGDSNELPGDVAWAYVGISGDYFCEAVTLIIRSDGERLLIRSVEWGRP